MKQRKVVVIGAGVIGASCAYFLRRSGWDVTVLDRGEVGKLCSHANCGYVSPSHVLPLTTPGALKLGPRALFDPQSPLRIKLNWDFKRMGWLLRFARRCNHRDMMHAAKAIHAMLFSARSLYDELFERESFDCEWEKRGLLFVLQTQHGMKQFAETDKLLTDAFKFSAKRIEPSDLQSMEPALKPGAAGAYWYETDAHLRPDKLMREWKRILTGMGVDVRTVCNFDGFSPDGDIARTSGGEFDADAFVVATGALTPMLNDELGANIPIQPGKGYSITMARPKLCPTYPLIFEEHKVAVTPFQSGYRLGSTMEFAGYDATLDRRRLEMIRRSAALYLHEPEAEPVVEEWFGWRPMTYDSVPIIDRSPKHRNVIIAAGHNMLGLSMAPATGKLVSEILNQTRPHLDPAMYSLARFG